MTTHSIILAWRIPMVREAWQATVPGVAKSRTRVSDYAQHRTVARQAPLSIGFSKQEHWSGLPFPPPRYLPDLQGLNLLLLHLLHEQANSLPLSHQGSLGSSARASKDGELETGPADEWRRWWQKTGSSPDFYTLPRLSWRLRTAGSSNSFRRWPSSSGTWRSSTCESRIYRARCQCLPQMGREVQGGLCGSGCGARQVEQPEPARLDILLPVLSQMDHLAPRHLGHEMAKPTRRKRLPKMAQLAGTAHNISRLHSECSTLCWSLAHSPQPHPHLPFFPLSLSGPSY